MENVWTVGKVKSRQLAVLVSLMVCAWAGAAFGQLADEDIAALQERGKAEGWTFRVAKNPATERPLEQLCGLKAPDGWWENAPFDPCTPERALPASYDWRDLGGTTSVKDQGGCGSCWAFATVGALECNILIKDAVEVDLSEQWLVSCNRNGWSCDGGWWAHSYHQWKTDSCGYAGAVLEAGFPYVASDAACNCPYTHVYFIDSWAYIGDSRSIPATSAVKQAIMDYGPVSASVYVNSAFQSYSGGVFNGCQSGTVNHGVVLVGWDDNQGDSGVWFLRNSWGTGWGESGYMRIPYGCSKIGYAACYVDYAAGGGQTAAMPIRSKNPKSGVTIGVDPGDHYGQANGATPFTRTFYRRTPVTLTAPATASGNGFSKWLKNGADHSTSREVTVAADADTYKAVYLSGDRYEPDDKRRESKRIRCGEKQTRSIHRTGNVDWVELELSQGCRRVLIQTDGPAGGDTEMCLYKGSKRKACNNNGGTGRYSRIVGRDLAPGTYYIKIWEHGKDATISRYNLKVNCKGCAAAACP